MTFPQHLSNELEKYVDKPVFHWHILIKNGIVAPDFPLPDKLILMKMVSGRYYVGKWSNQRGFHSESNCLGETVAKWMYIPEE